MFKRLRQTTLKIFKRPEEHADCAYYTDSGTCLPLSMDIPNNIPAFGGDLLNVITALFNIKIAIDNHKRRIARREFKEKLITEFLKKEVYQKDDIVAIREWFAQKCVEENVALSIRDICAWKERLLLIQHLAKKSEDNIEKLLNFNNKKSEIRTQTAFGVTKHAVFGIAGVLGICGIAFGVVALAFAFPIAIPLIAAVGFQTVSGIYTSLWCSANSVESGSKLKYARKKRNQWRQFGEIESLDKDIKRIYEKKLRNSESRYKMEKYRGCSLAALIGGAVGMSVSSIMLATGLLLSSTVVGSAVGVPLMIAGGILGAVGAISYIAGYAGNVCTRRKENQIKENNRIKYEAKDDSGIMKIIREDPELQKHKKELHKVQKKGDYKAIGLSLTGLVTIIPAIPLSFLVPPLAIVCTIAGTTLLTAGIISSVYTKIKTQKIRKKIVRREYELVDKVKKAMSGYEKMPIMPKSQPKPSFWQKIKNIFSRKKKLQQKQAEIKETVPGVDTTVKMVTEIGGVGDNKLVEVEQKGKNVNTLPITVKNNDEESVEIVEDNAKPVRTCASMADKPIKPFESFKCGLVRP